MINILKEKFNCDVGYSGHEKSGLAISYAATALGITSLEAIYSCEHFMVVTRQLLFAGVYKTLWRCKSY